jgi:PBP1b-binding outer membrane lipoprotein LpoB
MKAVALILVVVAFIAGCAGLESPSSSASSSASPSVSSDDRPDLRYTSQKACESAGRLWNIGSGVCM